MKAGAAVADTGGDRVEGDERRRHTFGVVAIEWALFGGRGVIHLTPSEARKLERNMTC